MPIDSSSKTVTAHGSRFRARFAYLFADDVIVNTGPHNVVSEAAADTLMAVNEPDVLLHKQQFEADREATADDPIVAQADATEEMVCREYLRIGMQEQDPFRAYKKLKKPIDWLIAKGWSPTEIKANLQLTDEQWDRITSRYTYLQLDPTTMVAYEAIRAGDNF